MCAESLCRFFADFEYTVVVMVFWHQKLYARMQTWNMLKSVGERPVVVKAFFGPLLRRRLPGKYVEMSVGLFFTWQMERGRLLDFYIDSVHLLAGNERIDKYLLQLIWLVYRFRHGYRLFVFVRSVERLLQKISTACDDHRFHRRWSGHGCVHTFLWSLHK